MKKVIYLVATLICFCNFTYSQEFATDKGAVIISGSAGFSSQNGDIYENGDGKGVTTITLIPNINFFVSKNFFIGGGLSLSSQSQGDMSASTIGIGPQCGFAIGKPEATVIPFFLLGVRYASMSISMDSNSQTINGSIIGFGGGLIFPVKQHIGISIDINYNIQNMKYEGYSFSGNTFNIGVGITGLLF